MADSFTSQMNLIFKSYGVSQILKDFAKLQLGVTDTAALQKKYNTSTEADVMKVEKRTKSRIQAAERATKADARAKQEEAQHVKKLMAQGEVRAHAENQAIKQKVEADKKSKADIKKAEQKVAKEQKLRTRKETELESKKYKNKTRFHGEWLSIMFMGMQLMRTFGGVVKGMVKTYKEFTKNAATPMSESLVALSANWKFLQFAMMDALQGGVLNNLMDWFANLANTIAKMNPDKLKVLSGFFVVMAGIGVAAFAAGQFMILFTSMRSAAAMRAGIKALEAALLAPNAADLTKVNGLSAMFKNMSLLTKGAITVALGAAVVLSTIKVLNSDNTTMGERAMNIASATALGAWIGSLILPGVGTAIGAVIGFSASLILNIKDVKMDNANQSALLDARRSMQELLNEAGTGVGTHALEENLIMGLGKMTESSDVKDALTSMWGDLLEQKDLGIIDEEAYRSQMVALVGAVMPEVEKAMIDSNSKMFQDMANQGTAYFDTDMKDAVTDFLTDEERGMAAMQREAEKYNETMSAPINKTINVSYDYGDGNSNSSVNPNDI